MNLSHDLVSQFAKITNSNDKKIPSETVVYGTTVLYDGRMYVKIDGSDLITPIETTSDVKDNQRVTIMIKDHSATITGNITDPSVGNKKVDDAKEEVKTEVKTEVMTEVTTKLENLEVVDLTAVNAEIENLKANKAEITDLTATNATIENLKATKAEITDLTATNATIENLKATKAEITDLTATNANITNLNADVANIKTLVNGNLTSDNILSFLITADKVTMADAFIKDAHIANINAAKINAGTINTANVSITSEDGGISIADETMQFKDENGVTRIQIGRDTSGNFTFVLYDENGTGQLINADGIQSSDAIKDGLIRDDHVSDDAAISGSKLDISSVITEINEDNSTTIKSNKIYLNEKGQSLEVAFNSLVSKVDTIEGITINGDLSSVIEQVQSNTTEINIAKEGINTLTAQNTTINQQIINLDGELETVNTTLSSKYSTLEQNFNGFKTTVADTYATKDLLNNYSTTSTMNSAIEQKANSILSTVSSTYVTNDTLNNYSTTTEMNSAIEQKANSILSTVSSTYVSDSDASKTYATKSELNQTSESWTATFESGFTKGIVEMNQYGIKVTHSDFAGWTHITSSGFYVHNGTEDVVMCTTGGLTVKGTLTASNIYGSYMASDSSSTPSFSLNSSGEIYGAKIDCESLAADGVISTSTLIVDNISNKAYPKALVAGGTIYVNSSTGDDDNEFKAGNKFATLQGAIDSIPKNMNGKSIKIQLENNITENVDINYFASGTLSIYCNGKTIYGYINVKGCSSYVYILGGSTASSSNNTGVIHPRTGVNVGDRTCSVGAVQSNYVSIQYMKIYAADNQASGITANKVCVTAMTAANVYINTVAVTKTDVGFRATSMASIHANKSSGVAAVNGFQASSGGKISFANNSQTGGNQNATYSSTGGQIWLGSSTTFEGGSTSTDTTTAPSTTVTKTATYTANYADTYRSTVYNNWKKDGTARQGNWGYGNCTGCWFFGDDFENISGKTVTKVQITFTRQSGGYNASRTHYFYTHNHESRPSGAPSLKTAIGTTSAAVGDTVTYTITNSSYISAIKSAKGIAIRDTSYSKDKYSVCSGTMKVKFTYTVTT